MPLINGLDKAKLPDIRRAKGCLEWLYVGANSATHSAKTAESSQTIGPYQGCPSNEGKICGRFLSGQF
jgi:hypothetical protein